MAAQAPSLILAGTPQASRSAQRTEAYSLADLQGEHGTLIMFICNHCPYVKAVIDRIVSRRYPISLPNISEHGA